MATIAGEVVKADEAYSRDEFLRRAGLSQSAFRAAQRRGLRVVRDGKRVFVIGGDWISYLSSVAGRDSHTEAAN